MLAEGVALDHLFSLAEIRFAHEAQAAADDDHLRVEDIHEVGEANAEVDAGFANRRVCFYVAGIGGLVEELRVRFLTGSSCQLCEVSIRVGGDDCSGITAE